MKDFGRNPSCQLKANCNEKALQDIVDEAMPYLEPVKHQLEMKLFPCELHQLVMQRKLAKLFPELKETQIRKNYSSAPFPMFLDENDILKQWNSIREDPISREAYHRLSNIYEEKRLLKIKKLYDSSGL